MSTNTKIIIGVVIAGAVGIGAYLLFFNNNSDAAVLSAQTAPASAAEISFLNLASQTEAVTFDTTILSDPRFKALVDIHTAIVPEPQGRINPFAPLSGSASSAGN